MHWLQQQSGFRYGCIQHSLLKADGAGDQEIRGMMLKANLLAWLALMFNLKASPGCHIDADLFEKLQGCCLYLMLTEPGCTGV